MRHRRTTAAGLLLALALGSLAFQCGGGGGGSSSQPESVRTAARAADAIAGSIKEMTTVKRELARQGTLTPDEELRLTQTLLRLNTADKAFVRRLKSLNGVPDASGRAELLAMFNEVTAALDDLNTNGVLGVSNQGARDRLGIIVNTLRGSVQIIQTFVQSQNRGTDANANN